MAHQHKGQVKSIPNGPFSCMSHHFLINWLANNLMLIFVINSGGGKIELRPPESAFCVPEVLSVALCPCLLLTVTQPDRLRSNREAGSVKWLSCKYRLTWSRSLVMCELIQHSASSLLTSGRVWIICTAQGHLCSAWEQSSSHCSCYTCTRVCVWERKCVLRR